MRFMVSRTSAWDDEVAPCDGATREQFIRIDERTTNDPSKVAAYYGKSDWWYKEGRNHRIEGGRIRRDFDATEWFIRIDSIDELVEFAARNGRVIVGNSWQHADIPSIEIYDDYRE